MKSILFALVAALVVGPVAAQQADPGLPSDPSRDVEQKWSTYDPGPLGDPRAKKGGSIRVPLEMWPTTFRIVGPGSNTTLGFYLQTLCYESLCRLDPKTLRPIPGLASHWHVSEDRRTVRFRIDPEAKWSDGPAVTAEDVVATYRLIMDETLNDASYKAHFHGVNSPRAVSPQVVEVTFSEPSWRQLTSFMTLSILPAHEIGDLSGSEFLERYDDRPATAVTGPYAIDEQAIAAGREITLLRRKDYWGLNRRINTGVNNFDAIRFFHPDSSEQRVEALLNGTVDVAAIYVAKTWIEILPASKPVKNNYLIRQKIYTDAPRGFSGIAINMRKPPLDDVRVRRALAHLYDRRRLVKELAHNEYEPLASYFSGVVRRPDAKPVEFDPATAAKLLDEAGWTRTTGSAIRTKDDKPLSLALAFYTPAKEPYYKAFAEECRKAGVEIVLEQLDPVSQWQGMMERTFDLAAIAWAGLVLPNPKASWSGALADEKNNSNVPGFKRKRADAWMDQYDKTFSVPARSKLLSQLDAEIFAQHPYILEWYLPCERIVFWNKFGRPASALPRYGQWSDCLQTWWYDEAKAEALEAARAADQPRADVPPLEVRPWRTETGDPVEATER